MDAPAEGAPRPPETAGAALSCSHPAIARPTAAPPSRGAPDPPPAPAAPVPRFADAPRPAATCAVTRSPVPATPASSNCRSSAPCEYAATARPEALDPARRARLRGDAASPEPPRPRRPPPWPAEPPRPAGPPHSRPRRPPRVQSPRSCRDQPRRARHSHHPKPTLHRSPVFVAHPRRRMPPRHALQQTSAQLKPQTSAPHPANRKQPAPHARCALARQARTQPKLPVAPPHPPQDQSARHRHPHPARPFPPRPVPMPPPTPGTTRPPTPRHPQPPQKPRPAARNQLPLPPAQPAARPETPAHTRSRTRPSLTPIPVAELRTGTPGRARTVRPPGSRTRPGHPGPHMSIPARRKPVRAQHAPPSHPRPRSPGQGSCRRHTRASSRPPSAIIIPGPPAKLAQHDHPGPLLDHIQAERHIERHPVPHQEQAVPQRRRLRVEGQRDRIV